jgi:voltage-gated potassium channel
VISPRLEQRLTDRLVTLTLRKALYMIVAVATTLAVAAAVLERLIDPAFDTFPKALWFAMTTVSTVGYGDYVPETGAGRIVASILMLTGLGFIPLLTSVVVSTMVAQRGRPAREEELHQLDLIAERLEELDRKLEGLGPR